MNGCGKLAGVIPYEEFSEYYQLTQNLGAGAFSAVFKVKELATGHFYALKKVTVNEFNFGCITQSLKHYTHSLSSPLQRFIMAFNRHNIDIVIQLMFRGTANATDQSNDIIEVECIIMPLYEQKFKMASLLDDTAKRSIIFELAVACMSLDLIGLKHNDLNPRNIMLTTETKPRIYTINNTTYVITCEYMPVIIDYGIAKLDENCNNVGFIPFNADKIGLHINDPFTLEDFNQFIAEDINFDEVIKFTEVIKFAPMRYLNR